MTFSKLGTDTDTGQFVEIPQSSRREGLYIIGATGTGKSTLIENLILQDINQELGVCVLDPHGDLVTAVISRMRKRLEDVILIDLESPEYVAGLNLFHCENPKDPFEAENVVQAVMHILAKVYNISRDTPLMNQFFINITRTLIYNPQATVLDIPRLLTNEAFRQSLLANVPDSAGNIHWFWTELYEQQRKGRRLEEILTAVTDKLDEFNSDVLKPWFGQNTHTLNMRQIMDERKILLVKLKARWQSMNSLIGSIFIAQILDAAYSRADAPVHKRKQFNVYADEFQTFASQDFAQLFTEARKYGIGITISHQVFEQLDLTIKATMKQAANIVVFRVSSDNAKEIAGEFDCTPPPGDPIREQIMVPQMQAVPMQVWEPSEKEAEYQQALHDFEMAKSQAVLLYDLCFPPLRGYWENRQPIAELQRLLEAGFEPDQRQIEANTSMSPNLKIKEQLTSSFFHVDFHDERVREFLLRKVFVPGTDINNQKELLQPRTPGRQAWHFPIELPCQFEMYLVLIIAEGDGKNWWTPHFATEAATLLLSEVQAFATQVKKDAVYRFDPLAWGEIQMEGNKPYTWDYGDRIYYGRDKEQYGHTDSAFTIRGRKVPLRLRLERNAWERNVKFFCRLEEYWKTPILPQTLPWMIAKVKSLIATLEKTSNEAVVLKEQHYIQITEYLETGILIPEYEIIGYEWHGMNKVPIERPKYRLKPGNPPYGSDEVERRTANQIKQLPKYTARVRISSGEYTIATEKPSGYCTEQVLQQRIADIQKQNLDKKYLRKRDDVEAEMAQRRKDFQPSLTPQQTQHHVARQVPVQGKCSNCGFSNNPPGAKFCNQCGETL